MGISEGAQVNLEQRAVRWSHPQMLWSLAENWVAEATVALPARLCLSLLVLGKREPGMDFL